MFYYHRIIWAQCSLLTLDMTWFRISDLVIRPRRCVCVLALLYILGSLCPCSLRCETYNVNWVVPPAGYRPQNWGIGGTSYHPRPPVAPTICWKNKKVVHQAVPHLAWHVDMFWVCCIDFRFFCRLFVLRLYNLSCIHCWLSICYELVVQHLVQQVEVNGHWNYIVYSVGCSVWEFGTWWSYVHGVWSWWTRAR